MYIMLDATTITTTTIKTIKTTAKMAATTSVNK